MIFSFNRKPYVKFSVMIDKSEKEPFVAKYVKEDGTKVPMVFFKYKGKFFVFLFRYWKKKNFGKIWSEEKAIKFWKEGKIRCIVPLSDYMDKEDKEKLLKANTEQEIMKVLRKIGKKIGLHRIIV